MAWTILYFDICPHFNFWARFLEAELMNWNEYISLRLSVLARNLSSVRVFIAVWIGACVMTLSFDRLFLSIFCLLAQCLAFVFPVGRGLRDGSVGAFPHKPLVPFIVNILPQSVLHLLILLKISCCTIACDSAEVFHKFWWQTLRARESLWGL